MYRNAGKPANGVVNGLETGPLQELPGISLGRSMTKVLIVATYSLFAMAIGGAIGLFAGAPMGTLTGVVVFLLLAQLDGSIVRRRDRKAQAREIAQLKRANAKVAMALDDAREKMEAMNQAIEAKTSAQGRKIVSELKVLESLMREFAGRISEKARETAPEERVSFRPAAEGASSYLSNLAGPELLETIRASLEENRVDLYLQPMVSLPQRKLRYYEALSRLRSEDGAVIMPAQYIKVAAPAGLMSIVDNLLLFRAVQIVKRLIQKHREVGVFCNISGDTLVDAEFFPQFLEYMQQHKDLANQIVFEFAQSAVLRAGTVGEANLRALGSLGFALSMDHVETLALDYPKLKTLGFRHLKVRADTLTRGMTDAQSAVAAEDIKALLARHGLNLIAERVEDEKTVLQLLDYGVDFAQGFLFGEPRAMRDDSLKAMEKEPALAPIIPFRRAS
jgi:cyclic-di-GMP phosphodiesterase TipF (flagellum assembly factor)